LCAAPPLNRTPKTPRAAEVERAALFAPLHNRANLRGVTACDDFFPGRKQVLALLDASSGPLISRHAQPSMRARASSDSAGSMQTQSMHRGVC
jgi:hypothetical protein